MVSWSELTWKYISSDSPSHGCVFLQRQKCWPINKLLPIWRTESMQVMREIALIGCLALNAVDIIWHTQPAVTSICSVEWSNMVSWSSWLKTGQLCVTLLRNLVIGWIWQFFLYEWTVTTSHVAAEHSSNLARSLWRGQSMRREPTQQAAFVVVSFSMLCWRVRSLSGMTGPVKAVCSHNGWPRWPVPITWRAANLSVSMAAYSTVFLETSIMQAICFKDLSTSVHSKTKQTCW